MFKGKNSIRTQFAFIFIALLFVILAICVFINSTFLQRYLLENKRNVLKTTYNRMNELFIHEENEELTEADEIEFEQICSDYNVDVLVMDSSLDVLISSFQDDEKVSQRLLSYIFMDDPNYLFKDDMVSEQIKENNKKDDKDLYDEILEADDKYVIRISTDPRMHNDYLELMGTLDNDNILLIRNGMRSMKINAAISNRFLIYVVISAVVLGTVLIWMTSNTITKPILQLAELSNRMSQLDFEAKYTGNTNNEIDYLGERMNLLSKKLEETITELKQANNELKADLSKREELDEMRSEFISMVSHELKTPLALIQGYAEGLCEEVNDSPESRAYYCEVIVDEAAKMNRMVCDLLNLNHLEFGNAVVEMEHFDIVELIKNYLESVQLLTEQSKVSVECDMPGQIYVWGDDYRISEVIANYFTNALHYVKEGGIIRISVVKRTDKVRVSVFNTGDTISEEVIERVWEKFYKADKARSREYGGSGVGLSIVKAIMELHHQEYGVLNKEDGVEFYFELDCN